MFTNKGEMAYVVCPCSGMPTLFAKITEALKPGARRGALPPLFHEIVCFTIAT